MYNAEYTRTFYNAYGDIEWQRLEATPYGRLQAIIHEDMLKKYVKPGDRVLDAGSGPGRFSIAAAKAGAKVTVLDISDKQLEIARGKITGAGQIDRVERFIRADICDLAALNNGQFDVAVCFGGALSYVCEKREKAAAELIRVVKPGGILLVSAMSLFGPLIGAVQFPDMPDLKNPDGAKGVVGIWPVVKTGDLYGMHSKRLKMIHAAMHLFTTEELVTMFKQCEILETAASNVIIKESGTANEQLGADPAVWATVVELEKRFNHEPGLVDTGSHIIVAARKKL
jgi:ubiquinone/menaquinone biosynthesis C-methylase UbiE